MAGPHNLSTTPSSKKVAKIQVRGLKKSFGGKVVLDNIDLDILPGESFVIIGGSGTGKSVLIKCMLGLLTPDAGEIFVDGHRLSGMTKQQRAKVLANFGMLFQGGALFDSLSLWRNVAFQLLTKGMSKKQARQEACDRLKEVDLDPKLADSYPSELSGGMQKRVSLARAIASQPDFIFFDEPTTGLDPIVSGIINRLIIKNVRHLGASALTITHDIQSLRAIADRVGLLYKGKLIWVGTVAEMDKTDNPFVQQFIHGLPDGPFTSV